MAGEKSSEEILDLDVFAPVPTKSIRFKKRVYPVISFFDLTAEEALKLLRIEEDAKGKPIDEQLTRLREQVKLMVPTLPEDELKKLSWHQLVAVTREAWLLARPQPAAPPTTVEAASSQRPAVSEPSSPA